jgi:hypothetical protein
MFKEFFENPAIRHVLIGSQLAGNLKSTSGETTIRNLMIFDSRFMSAGTISNRNCLLLEREVRRAAISVARKPPPHQIHAASGPREAHRRGGATQSPLAHPGDPRPRRLQLDGLAKVRQRLRQRDGCVLRDKPRANVAPLEKMEVRLSHRHLLSAAVQEEKGGVLAHERSPRTDLPEDATRRNAREETPTQTADDHSRQGLEVQESRDNPILRLRS